MPTKFAKFTNNIFKYLVFFCLSFIWVNFYYHKFLASVLISIIIASAICLILTKISYETQEKQKLKSNQLKQANFALTQLKFYNFNETINYFNTALLNLGYTPINKQNYLIVNNTILFPCFNKLLDEQTFLTVFKLFKEQNLNKLVFLCFNTTEQLDAFLSTIEIKNIEILKGEQVFLNFIEPSNTPIKTIVELKQPSKLRLSELKNVIFNKSRAKGYFISGLILMITSLFYPYGIYYQIFGTLLFSFCLFSFYNKKFNAKSQNKLFE